MLLAVTACTAGIAHTYMAAEALKKSAEAAGADIKVETQGTVGVENPITADEVERIRCAQRARGAVLEGSLAVTLRGWRQVLVPLVVALLRRADDLAEAMSDRCYTGEQTALLAPPAPRDWATLLCGVLWAVAALLL